MSRNFRGGGAKIAVLIGLAAAITVFFFLYDIGIALTHTNAPHFYAAPDQLCKTQWIGITLPPFGIWVCKAYLHDGLTRRHELAHWDQYKRFGTLGFYANYIWAWIRGGFNYDNNWMEIEARQKSGGS